MRHLNLLQRRLDPTDIGELQTQSIYHGDFFDLVKKIPDQSIDIIICDPPYNASKGRHLSLSGPKPKGFGGDWSIISEKWDNMSFDDYFDFTVRWLTESKRVLKSEGSIWVHGSYHSIGFVNVSMQMLKMQIINEIIWYKRNSIPNLSGRRLTASHESILWANRGNNSKYIFNYEVSKNWSCSTDSLKIHGKQMRTVWDIPNNKNKDELRHGSHPAQKPLLLSQRFIQLSSFKGAICFVPFAGSGSECLAAQREGLHYIGFELDDQYISLARSRLEADE